jgi:hypothetical protein
MAKAIVDGQVENAKVCKVISESSASQLKDYCKTIKNNKGETIVLK